MAKRKTEPTETTEGAIGEFMAQQIASIEQYGWTYERLPDAHRAVKGGRKIAAPTLRQVYEAVQEERRVNFGDEA